MKYKMIKNNNIFGTHRISKKISRKDFIQTILYIKDLFGLPKDIKILIVRGYSYKKISFCIRAAYSQEQKMILIILDSIERDCKFNGYDWLYSFSRTLAHELLHARFLIHTKGKYYINGTNIAFGITEIESHTLEHFYGKIINEIFRELKNNPKSSFGIMFPFQSLHSVIVTNVKDKILWKRKHEYDRAMTSMQSCFCYENYEQKRIALIFDNVFDHKEKKEIIKSYNGNIEKKLASSSYDRHTPFTFAYSVKPETTTSTKIKNYYEFKEKFNSIKECKIKNTKDEKNKRK